MGPVVRRLFVLLALAALAVPSAANASTTTYHAPYQQGPAGGDTYNTIMADPATGDMTVIRLNPAGISGGLGCAGSGGFTNFEVTHTATTAVTSVVVSYTQAIVDPYSWIDVAVRQDDQFLGARVERGILAGDGSVTLTLPSPATGTITVRFGLQVSSACPNIDGAHATFTSVAINES